MTLTSPLKDSLRKKCKFYNDYCSTTIFMLKITSINIESQFFVMRILRAIKRLGSKAFVGKYLTKWKSNF